MISSSAYCKPLIVKTGIKSRGIHNFSTQFHAMRNLVWAFIFAITGLWAQDKQLPDFKAVDSLYREDQFYFGITYNLLKNKPDRVKQNKLSMGFSGGFLRDMPFNEKRTWAVAAGLGYSYNNFNHNLQMTKLGNDPVVYTLFAPDDYFEKNKLILHYLDLPIELRWRTSTPDSHKFWRVYTGFKLSYLIYDQYKYRGDSGDYTISHNPDLSKLMYGIYLSAGYNTWNINVYYSLNEFYENGNVGNQPVGMRTLNMGLMFYIL